MKKLKKSKQNGVVKKCILSTFTRTTNIQGQEDGSEGWNRYRLRRGRSIRGGDGEIDAYVKTGR